MAEKGEIEITRVFAREILDSRGNPTLEVELRSKKKNFARAAVPSGASTGIHEAHELRDKDKKRFFGKGVTLAVKNVNTTITNEISGHLYSSQKELDSDLIALDATQNKKNLGANAILGVSLAFSRLFAKEKKVPLYTYLSSLARNKKPSLPIPAMNILNGGAHAGNELDFQEYMVVPMGVPDFKERVRMCSEVYHELKTLLSKKYGRAATNVGDEGGFAPPMKKITEPLDLILSAFEALGYEKTMKIALDVAASEFFKSGAYVLEGKKLTSRDMLLRYETLIENYPIISIEDPFSEDDWSSWTKLTSSSFAKKINIVGDDLLVTNISRIERALEKKACNALLLKINQIGTITEAIDSFLLAKKNNWDVMVSHRSGETEDTFISDLSVGLSSKFIKSGAPCRGERTAKYNQLIRISEEI